MLSPPGRGNMGDSNAVAGTARTRGTHNLRALSTTLREPHQLQKEDQDDCQFVLFTMCVILSGRKFGRCPQILSPFALGASIRLGGLNYCD